MTRFAIVIHAHGCSHVRRSWVRPLAFALLAVGPLAQAQSAFEPFTAKDVVLVASPHPDDAELCCSGVMQRALSSGARVAIVWITNGDSFLIDAIRVEHRLRPHAAGMLALGAKRMKEAQAGAEAIGIAAENRFFLGYPDRGVQRLLLDHYYFTFHSRYTGASSVPYDGTLERGAEYRGENLVRNFNAVLDKLQPTYVLAPSPHDLHADHEGVGDLVIRLMGERGQLDRVRYWIVHGGSGWPRTMPAGAAFDPPPIAATLPWRSFELTPDEVKKKREAISRHRSQMEIMRPFLMAFVRPNELFSTIPLMDDVPLPLDLTVAPAAE
jgi:LmbE family N-acetylglucosaminyl deacetylase